LGRRTFFSFGGTWASGAEATATGACVAATVGGGASSIWACVDAGRASSECRKVVLMKSRCADAAWMLVRMSACSSAV
jgi:hypothetical protein